MKRMAATVVGGLIALSLSGSALAFGLPAVPGQQKNSASAGSKNVDADVGSFVSKSIAANLLINTSATHMLSALGEKKHAAEMGEKLKQISNIADPKEKASALGKFTAETQSVMQAEMEKKELKDQLKSASMEQKELLKKAFFNFALGTLQAKDLLPVGQSLVASVQTNPMQASKLLPVKDSIGAIQGMLAGLSKITSTMPVLMRAAKIKPEMPKSSADKAMDAGGLLAANS